MQIKKIHHVAYRCKDAMETVEWYGKYLPALLRQRNRSVAGCRIGSRRREWHRGERCAQNVWRNPDPGLQRAWRRGLICSSCCP